MADKKIIASASTPSDQDVLTWDDGTSTWVAQAAGGGLTGISVISGSDYVGFTPDTTGHDLILQPNQFGAIRRSTGGPARGNVSVCLSRPTSTYPNHVASGIGAVAIGVARAAGTPSIAIGNYPDAAGNYAIALGGSAEATTNAIGIGRLASATGSDSVAVGDDADATAANAVAIGHDSRSTVADAVSIGYDAEATQADAIAIGAEAKANRISSIVLSATGADSSPLTRDSTRINGLYHVVNLVASSADATPVEATSDGAAASTTDDENRNVVVLANDKVASFRLHMTAIQATTNDAAVYIVTGGVKCLAGTASIIGATTTTAYEDDAGWDCTVTTTGNRLVVTCTADAGGASTWRGTLTLTYED